MSTAAPTAPVPVDAYVTPEDLINAILATGGFDADGIQKQLGSRLATLASIKILEKRLKEVSEKLIPEANVEYVNLKRQLGQKAPRAFGVSFRDYAGSTSYQYTPQVEELEKTLKDLKDTERKKGLALKVVKPPSNGISFSIVT